MRRGLANRYDRVRMFRVDARLRLTNLAFYVATTSQAQIFSALGTNDARVRNDMHMTFTPSGILVKPDY